MPGLGGSHFEDNSRRIRAWTDHYAAKGCHPMKARDVACRKVRSSATWPPAARTA